MDTLVKTPEIKPLEIKPLEINTPPKNLKVVRIPTSGLPIRLIKVPLVDIGPGSIKEDDCKGFEKALGHIPDLKSITDPKDFSWAHRSLVGISAKTIPDYWDGDGKTTWKREYMMYLCVDKKSGLPLNKYLNKLLADTSGGRGARQDLIVYGESFVFKKEPNLKGPDMFECAECTHIDQDSVKKEPELKRPECTHIDQDSVKKEPELKSPDVIKRAEYIHMDQRFVDSAKYESRGKVILEQLLRGYTEGDFHCV